MKNGNRVFVSTAQEWQQSALNNTIRNMQIHKSCDTQTKPDHAPDIDAEHARMKAGDKPLGVSAVGGEDRGGVSKGAAIFDLDRLLPAVDRKDAQDGPKDFFGNRLVLQGRVF